MFARTASLLALLAAVLAAPARAQDTTAPEPAPAASAETPPAEGSVYAPSSDEEPATGMTAVRPEPEPPAVPPIMIVSLATGRVPPEMVDAVRAALVAQVTPMAGGRPVLPLNHPELSAAILACAADEACIGGQVSAANAIGAVIANLSRRTARGPVTLTLDIRDPVSGSPRLPTQTLELAPEADVAAALAPLTEALRPVMFSPPPPPPELLITVNVDGATVRIDDEVVGTTPVAAVRLPPGRHVVMITADDYSGARREVELDPGERERLDVTLTSSTAVAMDEVIAADGTVVHRNEWYEEWWVWTIVGGVVLVGVGVGVGVGVATSGPPPDPMGIGLPPIR